MNSLPDWAISPVSIPPYCDECKYRDDFFMCILVLGDGKFVGITECRFWNPKKRVAIATRGKTTMPTEKDDPCSCPGCPGECPSKPKPSPKPTKDDDKK